MPIVTEKVDTLVYVNGSASSDVRNIAKSITGPGVIQIHSREYLKRQSCSPSHAFSAGGEGTNLAVTQWMFDNRLVCALGLLGGGTQNVLYNEISKRGVMTVDEFLRTEVDQFPKESFFHPGQIGEEVIFNNHFGIGVYERAMGRLNADLRFLPVRGIRVFLARAIPMLIAVYGEPKMDIFSVVTKVGKISLFPGQDPWGEDISHGLVETWLDLLNSLRLGRRLRKEPQFCIPQNILRREQTGSFNVNISGSSIWIDGDTIRGSQMNVPPYDSLRGLQTVRRSDFAFPVVALKVN